MARKHKNLFLVTFRGLFFYLEICLYELWLLSTAKPGEDRILDLIHSFDQLLLFGLVQVRQLEKILVVIYLPGALINTNGGRLVHVQQLHGWFGIPVKVATVFSDLHVEIDLLISPAW